MYCIEYTPETFQLAHCIQRGIILSHIMNSRTRTLGVIDLMALERYLTHTYVEFDETNNRISVRLGEFRIILFVQY